MMKNIEDVLGTYDKVWGFKVEKEKEESITLKGIPLKIKHFQTHLKTFGIRVSLVDNKHEFFVRFNEYLIKLSKSLDPKKKDLTLFDFSVFKRDDERISKIFPKYGFYVYRDHIIFTEEKGAKKPLTRLKKFLEFYKEKFNIRTVCRETSFDILDSLEVI